MLCVTNGEGREKVDREKLKDEIERIEELLSRKSSKFIKTELLMYLKILKRQLKKAEKE